MRPSRNPPAVGESGCWGTRESVCRSSRGRYFLPRGEVELCCVISFVSADHKLQEHQQYRIPFYSGVWEWLTTVKQTQSNSQFTYVVKGPNSTQNIIELATNWGFPSCQYPPPTTPALWKRVHFFLFFFLNWKFNFIGVDFTRRSHWGAFRKF